MSSQVPRSADKNQPMMDHEHEEAQRKGGKRKCSMCARGFARTKKKGNDRSFIEGCFAAFSLCAAAGFAMLALMLLL
ncbi:hypothetical protein AB3S75_036242 [Citrus x aurantiifolia]